MGVVLEIMPLGTALACLTPGDVNLDHLVEMVSVSFLPSKVSIIRCDIPWNQATKCSCAIKSGKVKLCLLGHRGTSFGIIYTICIFI